MNANGGLCSFEGCLFFWKARGLCDAHYRQWRLGKDLTPVKQLNRIRHLPCSFEGCENKQWAKGYCSGHYNQQHEGRPLTPLRTLTKRAKTDIPVWAQTCTAPDCSNGQVAMGFCSGHYLQNKAGKPLTPLNPRGPARIRQPGERQCVALPDCDGKVVSADSLCSGHYKQRQRGMAFKPLRRFTSRDTGGKIIREVCAFDGCYRRVQSRGLCAGHYYQAEQGFELKPIAGATRSPSNPRAPQASTEKLFQNRDACAFHNCGNPGRTHGLCAGHYAQERRGEKLHTLRHHVPIESYTRAHKNVHRHRGPAKGHECAHCGAQAKDWALRHDAVAARMQHTNQQGLYGTRFSSLPSDYTPLCKDCHYKYDQQFRQQAGATVINDDPWAAAVVDGQLDLFDAP